MAGTAVSIFWIPLSCHNSWLPGRVTDNVDNMEFSQRRPLSIDLQSYLLMQRPIFAAAAAMLVLAYRPGQVNGKGAHCMHL